LGGAVPPTFSIQPCGPFDLAHQQRFFGSWPEYSPDPAAVAMAFPVEGWAESAAVVMRQPDQGTISGEVHGADGDAAKRAWEQALAVLSLDVDGTDFPKVGERDPVIGGLQREHGYLGCRMRR
jgi:DNA-3-methyladenine glycosylase II